jgi:propanol-preferring alcohol dehydrogenase
MEQPLTVVTVVDPAALSALWTDSPEDATRAAHLDAAVLFAPAGGLVPAALAALAPGGTLAVAGIHLSDIPTLSYARHLFGERVLRSVTANTRRDGDEFLRLAAELPLRVVTQPYSFEDADTALSDLAADQVSGAAVLMTK